MLMVVYSTSVRSSCGEGGGTNLNCPNGVGVEPLSRIRKVQYRNVILPANSEPNPRYDLVPWSIDSKNNRIKARRNPKPMLIDVSNSSQC